MKIKYKIEDFHKVLKNTTTNEIHTLLRVWKYGEKTRKVFSPFIPPFSGCKVHIVTNKHCFYSIE